MIDLMLLCRPAVQILDAVLVHRVKNPVEAAHARSDLFKWRR